MQQECQAIIDQLFDELNNAKKAWGNNKLVNADFFEESLKELQINLAQETSQSIRIVNERQKILDNAKQNAERIELDARERAKQLVEDHQITVQANIEANNRIAAAEKRATDIVIAAQNKAQQIESECQDECDRKREATRRFIGKNFYDADSNISSAINAMAEVNSKLNADLEQIRNLYSRICSGDDEIA